MSEATLVGTPPEEVPAAPAPSCPDWSVPRRIAFRFGLVYFLLYASERICLMVGQLGIMIVRLFVSDDWMTAHQGDVIETLLKPRTWCQTLWDTVVRWTGANVEWLHANVTAAPLGSGDTTWNWVQILLAAVGALVAGVVWTAIAEPLGFRRHTRVAALGLVLLRYFLAAYLMSYGFLKVFSHQFSEPSLVQLTGRYGDFSPMGLLWRTMGFSPTYEVFAGAGEALAGVLLCFRRTTTLGALVGFGVMLNVVMMNFCFDVPVKIFSSHLLLFLSVLVALDTRRLLNVLVLNRPAPAAPLAPLSRPWLVAEVVAMAALAWMNSDGKVQALLRDEEAPIAPLKGVYDVVEMVKDGTPSPPLTTDATRWRWVIIEPAFGTTQQFVARTMVDRLVWYRAQIDEAAHTMVLKTIATPAKEPQSFDMKWSEPAPNELAIEGNLEGSALKLRLVRRDPREFLLTNRGFHWINEAPLNR